MDVIAETQEAYAALAASRAGEAQLINRTIADLTVVGVIGEGEVGKTHTIRQALGMGTGSAVVYLDFDDLASDAHIGWQLAKQIARAMTGSVDLSLLSVGALVPARLESVRVGLSATLGLDGLEEALREWPSGEYGSLSGLTALERFAEHRDVILWADHIEAPRLTPRHPVDVAAFFWGVRELHQRQARVRILVSGREGVNALVMGPRAAFYQQGAWITLDVPRPSMWRDVAERLRLGTRMAQELAALTNGHPQTMLLALSLLSLREDDPPRYGAEQLLGELASLDEGVASRAFQHARSLHRLGGQVLAQVARGQGPYAVGQRGTTSTQEVSKVLSRLRLAGLLRRGDRWEVVNPLVAIRARGTVAEPTGIDDWEDIDY